ncbi:D-alanine--D-alanine ligase [Thioflexithrix psekupsensis]|uniref:D-alanine--D-alanine ligase n=1 Tax=Thioflexithrix psekupsensis TaxID=1570016 RepID=A0A251X7H2_9GAMM|nr:D-alanine--D-alanine ligase [Thioflexithrix psekupsensis]OUD13280.1 D-alanine--D-alanine ligase [Thioflexithrix psekupsensis]
MHPSIFGKVAVLMGGNSAERDVSLRSGQAVLAALLRQGVEAVGIDTAHAFLPQLMDTRFDRAFIALHGRGGEDGTIQGLLEHLNLPYTGSGVLGSALGMDKLRCKWLWRSVGLPTPDFMVLNENSDWTSVVSQLGLPLMVKPVLEGSSVGISKVNTLEELQPAYQRAAQYQSPVIAECFITGTEYTAGILGTDPLPLIRLETPRTFYDYEAKYSENTQTHYHCPCGIAPELEKQWQQLVLQAFDTVGASGWGRIDLICDAQQQPWLLEINTSPGMTNRSLIPMAAREAGLSFDELVLRILSDTLPNPSST